MNILLACRSILIYNWDRWSNVGRGRRSHLLLLRLLLLIRWSNTSRRHFFLFLCLISWIENLSSRRRRLVYSHSSVCDISIWNSLNWINRNWRTPYNLLLIVDSCYWSSLLILREIVLLEMLLVHIRRGRISHQGNFV